MQRNVKAARKSLPEKIVDEVSHEVWVDAVADCLSAIWRQKVALMGDVNFLESVYLVSNGFVLVILGADLEFMFTNTVRDGSVRYSPDVDVAFWSTRADVWNGVGLRVSIKGRRALRARANGVRLWPRF